MNPRADALTITLTGPVLNKRCSGPEVIKLFSCSTQPKWYKYIDIEGLELKSLEFICLNVKMTTIVGILTFMSKINLSLG